MNYEEKYKEALDLMKDCVPDENGLVHVRPEDIFSELAESDDERIRKGLIENFKWFCGDFPETTKWGKYDNLLVKDIIAWLEKQGRKPAEWSEEDEKNLRRAIRATKVVYPETADWLKSLKDRVQPQNNIVTNKELAQAKKDAYNNALDKIEYHSGEPTFDDGWNAAIWYLKKRNDRP